MPKPEWGRWTQNGRHLYAHVFEQPIAPLALTGVDASLIESVRLLGSAGQVHMAHSWAIEAYPGVPFVSFGPEGGDDSFTHPLPHEDDRVIEITLRPTP